MSRIKALTFVEMQTENPPVIQAPEESEAKPVVTEPKDSSTDLVRIYLKEIGRIPLLSHEEELTEARKVQRYIQLLETPQDSLLSSPISAENKQLVQEGRRAKTRMIQANLRLVVFVAKKYVNRGLDLMDLIQEGSLGLERGVEKFDPTKGYRFSTYVYWWIRQAITRALNNHGRTIRLPTHVIEKLNALKKAQRQISQQKGRTATVAELAVSIDSSPEAIRKLLEQTRHPLSLDVKVGSEQDTELADLIESGEELPEDGVTQTLLRDSLEGLLAELGSRERTIVEMRFGLKGGEAQTLAEIGRTLNLSRERVRQIEVKALRTLRKPRAKEQVRDFLTDLD
jgi:RNA polymerase nonessential primary-like sigma factor